MITSRRLIVYTCYYINRLSILPWKWKFIKSRFNLFVRFKSKICSFSDSVWRSRRRFGDDRIEIRPQEVGGRDDERKVVISEDHQVIFSFTMLVFG